MNRDPLETLARLRQMVCEDARRALAASLEAESAANKERLKAECGLAKSLGLPGAPCLVTADGEIFWGNDRIEPALDWAGRA